MRLRSHLLVMTVATMAPVVLLAVIVAVLLVKRERDSIQDATVDRAVAVMSAVDAELRGSLTTLGALAASVHLRTGDLRAFRADAIRILESNPAWLNVSLALPDGQRVADTVLPPDKPLPPVGERETFDLVLVTGKPVIGNITTGAAVPIPSVPIRLPVLQDWTIKYVITAVVRLDSFTDVLRAQRLPEGWVAWIADRNGKIIARLPPVPPGQPLPERLRAVITRAPQGWVRGRTVEGHATYTPYVTSPFSSWVLGIAMPADSVDAAAWRTLWAIAALVLLALGGAVGLALVLGRRIARPIASLASATEAMGRGERVELPRHAPIAEIDSLAAALTEAAQAMRERQALVEREKAALQATDRAKDEFLAMLSHELRNPLAALTAAAHVLKLSEPGRDAAIKARAVVERQTKHMARLVGDLLDISRVAMGKVALERARVNLAEVISRVMNTWRASGRLERHRVSLEAAPAWVDADRARIEQIFSNLLDNAVKFTPAGKRIAVSVRPEGESAVLRVADEGEGVAAGSTERIFDLFVQGERGLDRGAGGLGVGLALVKRLTEMHSGTVTATSPGPGQGATFTVTLPAVLPLPEQAAARESAPRVTPRRVLIVEDNDDTRQMLHEALAFSGHDVSEARDGATALALAAESRPDVALIDIGLPDVDGYEVARRMRAAPGGRSIGLIAITGYGQAEDQRRAYEAGFDAHLTKPVAPERLNQVMAGLG
jgi:signal transduction histidine kinase/CheY-like chemotaxis protein